MLPVMLNNEGEENARIHIYTLSVTREKTFDADGEYGYEPSDVSRKWDRLIG